MMYRVAKLALCGALLFAVIPPAGADVTVVSTIRVKGDDPDEKDAPKKYTQTTYYKGTKRRVEEKGEVRIADSEAGKEYTLNSEKKTYVVRPLPGSRPAASVVPADAIEKKKAKKGGPSPVTPEVKIEPLNKSRAIAGKKARGIKYRIALRPPKPPAQPVAKGDADVPDLAGVPLNGMPTIEMSGEQWMTDEVTLPVAFQGNSLLPALLNGKAFQSQLSDADRERIRSQMSGLDLSGVLQIKVTFPKEWKGKKDAPRNADVRAAREVTSISEATLDDALFVVPAGYTEVEQDDETKEAEE